MPIRKIKPGLYANIHAKQERIAKGSGEKMRQTGAAGAPQAAAFDKAEKSARPAQKAATAKVAKPKKKSA